MHTMDSNFVAEEMELYDEIRSTLDEDELLIIMSRLQEHFLEKLAYQNEQRRNRESDLKSFAFQTISDTADTDFTELTETDNYDDSELDNADSELDTKSIISSASNTSVTSPNNTFAYPDDSSNPFQLPPRIRDGSTKSNESFKSKSSNKSKGKNLGKIKGTGNVALKATFFNNPTLTANNLNRHNLVTSNHSNKKGKGKGMKKSKSTTPVPDTTAKTASSMIKTTAAIGPTNSRPHTPSNKLKYRHGKHVTKPRGYSDAPVQRNKTIAGLSKLKGLAQSTSNPSSPHGRSVTLMTPQASAGAYRLDLFCDIKFVKRIFVRWISCGNEVLCHVASRTLGILFSHSYLTADQFLDLSELVLGVHEENNHIFGNVEVTYRPSRPGMFYGDVTDSSSSPIDSDYDSTPQPQLSESDESVTDLIENNDENKDKNGKDGDGDVNMKNKPKLKPKAPPLNVVNEHSQMHKDEIINKNDENFLSQESTKLTRRRSLASTTSSTSRSSRKNKLLNKPYDVHWDNRLYCAMKILTYIVSNSDVYEGCVVALDEWFSIIVIDLFRRSRKAGIGILEGFLALIKAILKRFANNKDVMGQCKLSQVICSDSNNELLDIITSRTSTLVTRASALELCPLLMMTSEVGAQKFAHFCLITVLDDGRFNPFEPGDITMSRTFQRGEQGQLRSINEKNPLEKSYTVANYIPSLLFQRANDVFIDQESVQRLTFLTVIKAMNILSSHIINHDDNDEKEKEKEKENTHKKKKKKRKKKREEQEFTDDIDARVDKLEGEFDGTTARKIRNFFSRDADYTRYRILELVYEEDDVLIQLLLELLIIETALRKSNSRLAQRIRYLFDPFMLFYDFIDCTDADYSFLMDFLVNNETVFLEYLLKFCKRMSANWNPTNATKEQVNRVMSILIRLRMHIQDLYQKGSFPYSPKALLKAMENVEFCYENEKSKQSNNKPNPFDLDYLNYVKKKNIQKKEKEEAEKLKKIEKKEKKPKKMMISSLFLQDVKYQREMEKRNSEIQKKQKQNLAKRAKKKKDKKVKTKRKTDPISISNHSNTDDELPNENTKLQTLASKILKSNRKKNKKSLKKKRNVKAKINLSSLKKIDFHKRLITHKVVNSENRVRIGF